MYVINEDISKGQFKKVYALFGEEEYLVSQYRNNLVRALTEVSDLSELAGNMNYLKISGECKDYSEVASFAQTLPFFAPRRVILLDGVKALAKSGDELSSIIENSPDTTFFIITDEKADKKLKIYKCIENIGHITEMKKQNEERLGRWITRKVNLEGKNITVGAVNELIERTDKDMLVISNELEKILAYCLDKDVIEVKDVSELVHMQISDNIFEMIDALGNRNQKKAMALYDEMLEAKEAPAKILWHMGTAFTRIYCVKEMRAKGFDKKAIADKMGLWSRLIDGYINQSRMFSLSELRQAMEDCTEYSHRIHDGRLGDRVSVELLIVKYSSKQ